MNNTFIDDLPIHSAPSLDTFDIDILVIGAGPAGIHFCKEYLKNKPLTKMRLINAEPAMPYDRAQLSFILSAIKNPEQIGLSMPEPTAHPNFSFDIDRATQIKHESQQVITARGFHYRYNALVLALGAQAYVPSINGINFKGVFTFRAISDAEKLLARITRSRHLVIVGGGLLGIESAKSLLRHSTQVTLIQQAPHLMNKQIDTTASALLNNELKAIGIKTILNMGVVEIQGEMGELKSIKLRSGERLICDTVLFCCGIQPNIALARKSGISVRRGIVVDTKLQTNKQNIYAIGECCEYAGKVYGLVAPCLEQADLLVKSLIDTKSDHQYSGSYSISELKVVKQKVTSIGDSVDFRPGPLIKQYTYTDAAAQIHRKIIVKKSKVIGIIGYGEWPELTLIKHLLIEKKRLYPWQLAAFKYTGKILFLSPQAQYSEQSIICHCKQIRLCDIKQGIKQHNTLEQLQKHLPVGTLCGSCLPQVVPLFSSSEAGKKTRTNPIIATCAILVSLTIIGLFLFLPQNPLSSVSDINWLDSTSSDGLMKQYTGFTMLSLLLIGLLMSLRKRLNITRLGSFQRLRHLHVILAAVTCLVLVLHTGGHKGSNFNTLLFTCFLLNMIVGSIAGFANANQKLIFNSSNLNLALKKLHLIIAWPLPALILLHIFMVYYY